MLHRHAISLLLALLITSGAAFAAPKSQQLYRWVDENGIVHYGDSVPAEFAEQDKDILNARAITVGRMQGRLSEEQIAEIERLDEIKAIKIRAARADRALLATYLSINEIERHRDRRVELLEAQARVSELYLGNLRRRLVKLNEEASYYKPYSDDENAELIRPELALDMKETKDSIINYETRLANNRAEALKLRNDFQKAIVRYADLTTQDLPE